MAKFLIAARIVLMVMYPIAIYVGLSRFSARTVGLMMLVLLGPGLVNRARKARREDLWAVLPLPLLTIALLSLSAILNDKRFVLALPVLINLVFLLTFGLSLRSVPMVERFARMQDGDLSPEKVRYCRTVTVVWSVFFACNGTVCAALALFASLKAWTLYTGLIAYVLIGMLGGVEYTVRKYRFRDYSTRLHDRLLARVFPPPEGSS